MNVFRFTKIEKKTIFNVFWTFLMDYCVGFVHLVINLHYFSNQSTAGDFFRILVHKHDSQIIFANGLSSEKQIQQWFVQLDYFMESLIGGVILNDAHIQNIFEIFGQRCKNRERERARDGSASQSRAEYRLTVYCTPQVASRDELLLCRRAVLFYSRRQLDQNG